MSVWSIDPGAARGILGTALTYTEKCDAAAEAHALAVGDAQAAATRAPATAAALEVVASDPLMLGVAAARHYIEDVVLKVDEVIGIYETGDLEVAQLVQSEVPGQPE